MKIRYLFLIFFAIFNSISCTVNSANYNAFIDNIKKFDNLCIGSCGNKNNDSSLINGLFGDITCGACATEGQLAIRLLNSINKFQSDDDFFYASSALVYLIRSGAYNNVSSNVKIGLTNFFNKISADEIPIPKMSFPRYLKVVQYSNEFVYRSLVDGNKNFFSYIFPYLANFNNGFHIWSLASLDHVFSILDSYKLMIEHLKNDQNRKNMVINEMNNIIHTLHTNDFKLYGRSRDIIISKMFEKNPNNKGTYLKDKFYTRKYFTKYNTGNNYFVKIIHSTFVNNNIIENIIKNIKNIQKGYNFIKNFNFEIYLVNNNFEFQYLSRKKLPNSLYYFDDYNMMLKNNTIVLLISEDYNREFSKIEDKIHSAYKSLVFNKVLCVPKWFFGYNTDDICSKNNLEKYKTSIMNPAYDYENDLDFSNIIYKFIFNRHPYILKQIYYNRKYSFPKNDFISYLKNFIGSCKYSTIFKIPIELKNNFLTSKCKNGMLFKTNNYDVKYINDRILIKNNDKKQKIFESMSDVQYKNFLSLVSSFIIKYAMKNKPVDSIKKTNTFINNYILQENNLLNSVFCYSNSTTQTFTKDSPKFDNTLAFFNDFLLYSGYSPKILKQVEYENKRKECYFKVVVPKVELKPYLKLIIYRINLNNGKLQNKYTLNNINTKININDLDKRIVTLKDLLKTKSITFDTSKKYTDIFDNAGIYPCFNNTSVFKNRIFYKNNKLIDPSKMYKLFFDKNNNYFDVVLKDNKKNFDFVFKNNKKNFDKVSNTKPTISPKNNDVCYLKYVQCKNSNMNTDMSFDMDTDINTDINNNINTNINSYDDVPTNMNSYGDVPTNMNSYGDVPTNMNSYYDTYNDDIYSNTDMSSSDTSSSDFSSTDFSSTDMNLSDSFSDDMYLNDNPDDKNNIYSDNDGNSNNDFDFNNDIDFNNDMDLNNDMDFNNIDF